MARELREVWVIRNPAWEIVRITDRTDEAQESRYPTGYTVSRLPLLTPEAAAVVDRACKLQDLADATGVDMDVDLFAASWGSFSRAVLAYQETRGSDAN
jgi:hypothetical protein